MKADKKEFDDKHLGHRAKSAEEAESYKYFDKVEGVLTNTPNENTIELKTDGLNVDKSTGEVKLKPAIQRIRDKLKGLGNKTQEPKKNGKTGQGQKGYGNSGRNAGR